MTLAAPSYSENHYLASENKSLDWSTLEEYITAETITPRIYHAFQLVMFRFPRYYISKQSDGMSVRLNGVGKVLLIPPNMKMTCGGHGPAGQCSIYFSQSESLFYPVPSILNRSSTAREFRYVSRVLNNKASN